MANVIPMKPRTRRKIHMRFIVLCCILILGILVGIGYITGLIGTTSNVVVEDSLIYMKESTPYVYTGNALFYLEDKKLYYDFLGNTRKSWVINDVDTLNLRLAASATACVVFNQNAMQCLNPADHSKVFSKEFVGEIVDIRCGNAFVAVLKREPNASLTLYLYTLKGEEITPIKCSDKFIMDFGFSGASDVLWTLSLNTTGVIPVSVLTTYGVSTSALTGINDFHSQIIEKALFSDTNIYLVSTHHVITLNAQRKEANSKLIYGWKLIDSSLAGSKPMLLLTPRKDTASQIISALQLLVLPDEVLDFSPPSGTIGAFLSNGRIVCITANELFLYSAKGKLESSYAFAMPVDHIIKLDDTHVLLYRNTGLSLAMIS